MIGMLLRNTKVRVHSWDTYSPCIVEEAFLDITGFCASILWPAVGVVFDQAVVYFLLFQPRGAALLDRIIRLVCAWVT